MIKFSDYPITAIEDLVRLKQRIEDSNIPPKIVDENLLIGSWNIRSFGTVSESWRDKSDSPKRNLRSLVYIAEIIKCFDVIAIQEVKEDTSGIRLLLRDFLGPNWGLIVSDVSAAIPSGSPLTSMASRAATGPFPRSG